MHAERGRFVGLGRLVWVGLALVRPNGEEWFQGDSDDCEAVRRLLQMVTKRLRIPKMAENEEKLQKMAHESNMEALNGRSFLFWCHLTTVYT